MTIIAVLAYFKRKIEELEDRKKEEKDKLVKMELDSLIVWHLEKGLEMIKFAKPGECPQKVIDYFLYPVAKRPDIERLGKLMEDK